MQGKLYLLMLITPVIVLAIGFVYRYKRRAAEARDREKLLKMIIHKRCPAVGDTAQETALARMFGKGSAATVSDEPKKDSEKGEPK